MPSLSSNRYAYKNRNVNTYDLDEEAAPPVESTRAETAAPSVDDGLGSIDFRSVTWIPIVTMSGGAGPKGFRVTSARVSLPRDPFATMAASWLRLGALKDRPDVLVLSFTAEAAPGALKRHQNEASWGGRSLLRALATRGWAKGEYELVEKSNCWLVTKNRVR